MNFKHILAALSLVALFASCDRTVDFQSSKFVTLDHYSYSVDETTTEVTIPVHIYNPNQSEVQVAVSAIESTAKAGTDFEITSPASGVLTFGPNDTTQVVKVQIKGQVGTYTGNKVFGIQVASATEGVATGNTNVAAVTIKDLDHPLAAFIGDWTSTGPLTTAAGTISSWTFTISPDPEDVNKVVIENLELLFAYHNGMVAPDYNVFSGEVNADKTKLSIKGVQAVGYYDYYIVGMTTPTHSATTGFAEAIEFNLNEDGSLTMPNGFYTIWSNEEDGTSLEYFVNGGVTFTK